MTHNIFLSYSREDSDLMNHLKDDFEQIGFTVWTDANIQPGSPSWKVTIEQAIRDADCIVVIFSPSAAQSKWVRAELDFAEAQEKSIFPVLAKGTSADAVPFGYSSHQWVDLRKEKDYNAGLLHLAEVIAHHIQVTPFGLTILKRNIQPTTTNIDGLPLRFLVPFILAVTFVGFIGLMALSNDQQSNNDDVEQTAEVTETALPTAVPEQDINATEEAHAPVIEQVILHNR